MTVNQRRLVSGGIVAALVLGAITVSVHHQRARARALSDAGAHALTPWPEWAGWWHTAAACLALPEKPISTTHWLSLAPTQAIPAILDPEPNIRALWIRPDTILFMAGAEADSALVLHELTHQANGKPGHPAKLFDGRCGVLPHPVLPQ